MKTCFKCDVSKPLAEFYPHPRMADGHLNKCKDCTRKDTATRVALLSTNPKWFLGERRRHRDKSARARRDGRASKPTAAQFHLRNQKYKTEHPDKRAAHHAVSNAVRDGRLIKQPCEKCGNPKAQAHHDDYSKPLDVRWLCIPHHNEHHIAEREREILSKFTA